MQSTQAQLEKRSAVTQADEDLATFHLNMAAGHLAKVTKLHPGVPTCKPKKPKKKKINGITVELPQDQKVYVNQADTMAEMRGSLERRFVGDVRGSRSSGAQRRLEVCNLSGGSGSLVNIEGEPVRYNEPYGVYDRRYGEFQETMAPGSPRTSSRARTLGSSSITADSLLARTTTGTLSLHDSARVPCDSPQR